MGEEVGELVKGLEREFGKIWGSDVVEIGGNHHSIMRLWRVARGGYGRWNLSNIRAFLSRRRLGRLCLLDLWNGYLALGHLDRERGVLELE